jgi:hypothetical protein
MTVKKHILNQMVLGTGTRQQDYAGVNMLT